MRPEIHETKYEFLKRCKGLVLANGEPENPGNAWCERLWAQKQMGVEFLSKESITFDLAVSRLMSDESMDVDSACKEAMNRHPEAYEAYENELTKSAENSVDEIISEKSLELSEKENIDIDEATQQVMDENPALAKLYRESYEV